MRAWRAWGKTGSVSDKRWQSERAAYKLQPWAAATVTKKSERVQASGLRGSMRCSRTRRGSPQRH
jgi:hypothetical protein